MFGNFRVDSLFLTAKFSTVKRNIGKMFGYCHEPLYFPKKIGPLLRKMGADTHFTATDYGEIQ